MRAVIFDFGGVFIDSPFAALEAAARERGVDPEVLSTAVFGDYERDTDHPWHRLERGETSLEVAREEIMELASLPDGSAVDPFELLGALAGGGVRSEMVDFCTSIRGRGIATGLLTNNAKEFEEFWQPLIPLEELFDDVVDSSAVGLRKPAREIYLLALDRLGVDAAETVFVDDAPGNVRGAEAVGIASVLVAHERSSLGAAIERIEELLRPR
ncbi:MAG: HAD family phosphatase [Microthrixaceae bacterium]